MSGSGTTTTNILPRRPALLTCRFSWLICLLWILTATLEVVVCNAPVHQNCPPSGGLIDHGLSSGDKASEWCPKVKCIGATLGYYRPRAAIFRLFLSCSRLSSSSIRRSCSSSSCLAILALKRKQYQSKLKSDTRKRTFSQGNLKECVTMHMP